MTFEIVGPKDDKSAEEPLKVWLEKGADGGIDLMAQDEKGETMKCPHCGVEINAGQLLRSIPSKRRSEASRQNGKRGGRPRKDKPA